MNIARMSVANRVALLQKVRELLDCAICILDDVFPDDDYATAQVTDRLRSIVAPDLFSDAVNIDDLIKRVKEGELEDED